MILSIVIPSFNRKEQLETILYYLDNQTNVNRHDFEVVVCDFSTDFDVELIVSPYKSLNITCLKVREKFNISKARNIGFESSKGNLITFLDVDIIIMSGFVSQVISKYEKMDKFIVFYYIYGVFQKKGSQLYHEIKSLTPEKFTNDWCKERNELRDVREAIFHMSDYERDRVPAPWAFGWSGAFSIDRESFIESGGFDESFLGWGAEDIDLVYRVLNNNIKYYFDSEISVLHVPHETNKSLNMQTNTLNKELMFKKYGTIEMEVHIAASFAYFNEFLLKLNNLHFSSRNPVYSSSFINQLNNLIEGKRSLCLGLDSFSEIKKLNILEFFSVNERMTNQILDWKQGSVVYQTLGLQTQFPNDCFEIIIIFDSYRFFDEKIRNAIYTESKRIGKKVYQITTKGFKLYEHNMHYNPLFIENDIMVIENKVNNA